MRAVAGILIIILSLCPMLSGATPALPSTPVGNPHGIVPNAACLNPAMDSRLDCPVWDARAPNGGQFWAGHVAMNPAATKAMALHSDPNSGGMILSTYDSVSGHLAWEEEFATLTKIGVSNNVGLVASDKLVFVVGARDLVPTTDGLVESDCFTSSVVYVQAFDLASGAPIWNTNTSDSSLCGYADFVDLSPGGGELVVIGDSTQVLKHSLNDAIVVMALNSTTGAMNWLQRISSAHPTGLTLSADSKTLFVAGSQRGFATDPDTLFAAKLRMTDGAVGWQTQLPGLGSANDPSPAIAYADGVVAVAGNAIVGLDAASGGELWQASGPYLAGIVATPDQQGFLASQWGSFGERDLRLNLGGATEWVDETFSAGRADVYGFASVQVAIAGGNFVTMGESQSTANDGVMIVIHNSETGQEVQWLRSDDPQSFDGDQIAISSDHSRILLTGSTNSCLPANPIMGCSRTAITQMMLVNRGSDFLTFGL